MYCINTHIANTNAHRRIVSYNLPNLEKCHVIDKNAIILYCSCILKRDSLNLPGEIGSKGAFSNLY